MHRIDDPTAVPTLPAPRAQGAPGYFTGGSPGTGGFLATRVRYEFMNSLQEELAAIVEAANLTLDKTNNNQVLAALRQMLRFKLMQDEYLYIDPAGSDSNDGLTPATPLATGQAAWNKALTIDLNNHNLILQFANGTYTAPILCSGSPLGVGAGSGVIIQGNVAQPSQVVFSTSNISCISASGADLIVQGVALRATGVPTAYQNMGGGLFAGPTSSIAFGNVIFEQCDFAHIVAMGSGIIQSAGNPYTIAGGGGAHLLAALGGYIANVNSAVSLTGSPGFSSAFAAAASHGIIAAYGAAYAGPATGQRFAVETGGLITTNGGGPNFLPGSVAGFADPATFGLYI